MQSSPTQIILEVSQKQASRDGYDCKHTLSNRDIRLGDTQGGISPLLPKDVCSDIFALQPHPLSQRVTAPRGFEPHSTWTSHFSLLAEELWRMHESCHAQTTETSCWGCCKATHLHWWESTRAFLVDRNWEKILPTTQFQTLFFVFIPVGQN